jgi:hypothetical protein
LKALTTAIFGLMTSSTALYGKISDRLYKGHAPDGATYPYVVFMLISDVPADTFTEKLDDVLIQFSLFSSASSSGEVEDIYTALKLLYDDCSLILTPTTLIWMKRENATLMMEDHTTPDGTVEVWHYAVDYNIIQQR